MQLYSRNIYMALIEIIEMKSTKGMPWYKGHCPSISEKMVQYR